MSEHQRQGPIETKAIVLGYAMSRLDGAFLTEFALKTWNSAYELASTSLGQPATTYKNLRDEFDPIHANSRVGWYSRPLRSSRAKVLEELQNVSDKALIELVRHILGRNEDQIADAIEALEPTNRVAAGVAERLLTGRLAEDFFLEHFEEITHFQRTELIDMRMSAAGYDFGIKSKQEMAIEVKGLRDLKGDILFTDREWTEAGIRQSNYMLALVRNIAREPRAELIVDPFSAISARCVYSTAITANWRASV